MLERAAEPTNLVRAASPNAESAGGNRTPPFPGAGHLGDHPLCLITRDHESPVVHVDWIEIALGLQPCHLLLGEPDPALQMVQQDRIPRFGVVTENLVERSCHGVLLLGLGSG